MSVMSVGGGLPCKLIESLPTTVKTDKSIECTFVSF